MAKSVLARTTTGEIQLTITIPALQIQKAHDEVLTQIAAQTTIAGFRKGKAPKKLVEEKTPKSEIYEKVIQKVVPESYLEAVGEHQLQPIISPKIELLKAKEGEDWEIRATTCESPKISLGDYKEKIRKVLAASKLWVPGKKTEDEKTQKIIQMLLETAKVDLPAILVEDEVNRVLSNLINQTNALGLTIEQYLSSIGKTGAVLRQEYCARVETELTLQFILEKIADVEKIQVNEEEVDELINATGDEKIKENLNTSLERAYLRGILRRRKALDILKKL